jgi:hypothetical protein
MRRHPIRHALENALISFRCGSRDVVYRHCRVFCRACGALIENCAGD